MKHSGLPYVYDSMMKKFKKIWKEYRGYHDMYVRTPALFRKDIAVIDKYDLIVQGIVIGAVGMFFTVAIIQGWS